MPIWKEGTEAHEGVAHGEALMTRRQYTLNALRAYWPQDDAPIRGLPIPWLAAPAQESLPPVLELVVLPDWAANLAPAGGLLVPSYLIAPGNGPQWARTDWLSAAFWYLHSVAERAWEAIHGPIHSFSFRLKGFDPRLWEHAWANRIALFLRRWALREDATEEQLGVLPEAEIVITHDVDAVDKTLPIRFKQSAFCAFNVLRALKQFRWGQVGRSAGALARFLTSNARYWHFDEITAQEKELGLRSCFFVYGGPGGYSRRFRHILFDPMYQANEPRLISQFEKLHEQGWDIGLHQSFDAYQDADEMRLEKTRLERAIKLPIAWCRQHWLRFSWERTWPAQQAAGLRLDMTLGFNDRPGFRNGAALRFRPWDHLHSHALELESLPMVLMDSHLYDYRPLERDQRLQAIRSLLEEVRFVHGTASVLWHTQVLAADYGWGEGFRDLVQSVAAA
jgi:hypothetical protein